jgi:hypothetical protein
MIRSTVCAWLFEGKSTRGPQNVSVLALDEPLLHSEKCKVIPAKNSRAFELARLLVRLDQIASSIVNANHRIM